ncbi:hypothetical protein HPB48_017923 [Haemaphysalis longicornis]|uniref:Uncharacterized protein n=1 Tax=Haemaphysalis longicornis TaxID=44386 RepID=A0A9J6GP66_HAELO|nr:hypothetical protein HPB48_017923 [Haemaphysalis longicornis]
MACAAQLNRRRPPGAGAAATTLCLVAVAVLWCVAGRAAGAPYGRDWLRVPFKYHDYDAMTAVLINATTARPDLATLYSVGRSGQGMR